MRLISEEDLKKNGLDLNKYEEAILYWTIPDFQEMFEALNDGKEIPSQLKNKFEKYVNNYLGRHGLSSTYDELNEIVLEFLEENKTEILEAEKRDTLKRTFKQRIGSDE